MFNDNGSPISLFSFQDIITSLTGIMIFFLLLLSLNILEISSQKTELSSAEKELTLVKEQNKIRRIHIKEISDDISSYRMRIRSASAKDESTLAIEHFNRKQQIKEQKKQLKEIEQEILVEKDSLVQVETKRKELSEKSKEIEEQLAKNNALANEIKEKKRKAEDIRKAIKQKKNSVSVTIDSNINRQPILVECSASKICVYDKVANEKIISTRHTPIASQLVAEVLRKLSSFPADKYYFVFLVKPSAVNYISYLLSSFQAEKKNAVWGLEPIYETEGVENE